jgi:hypothetical protein
MEFLEDNPNFEINLQNYEESKKTSKKLLKSIRFSGMSSNRNSSNNSPRKEQNKDILMYNLNIEKPYLNIVKTPIHNENKEISSEKSVTESPVKSSKPSQFLNLLKIKKTQKINSILDGLKSKNKYNLSPNTDLKLFGDLFPGPGQYYNPKMKIGQNQNFRYNNLYTKENEPNLTLKYKIIKDFYYNSKVGPGTYDPNNNIVYKSYSQNPKIFISQLERGPLFKINDTIGPGQYNLIKDYKKDMKSKSINQFKNDINNSTNIPNNIATQFPERNKRNIFNTFNNNNYDNLLNSKNSLNKKKDKAEEKSIRGTSGKNYLRVHQNYSWKGIPDFSGISIKYNETDNNKNIQNDQISYKKQNFNFDNQFKLNQEKKDISEESAKKLQKEILGYNKLYMPLIQNVQRDLSLKGNHIPGPCYYNYNNDSIEGDIMRLNKRIKKSAYKKWK